MDSLFDTFDSQMVLDRSKGNVQEAETKSIDKDVWSYNNFKGNLIKKPKKSRKNKPKASKNVECDRKDKCTKTQEDVNNQTISADTNNSEVIEIPRSKPESLLQVAIKNKGKYFAQKNRELVYAEKHPYVLKDGVFTNAEAKLYQIMDKTFNSKLSCIDKRILIFPKIRLADLIEVHESLRLRKEYLYRIASKHIDYVLCDSQTLDVICVVELDDFYHTRSDKIERDKFVNNTLRDCGLQLFRVDIPIKNVTPESLGNILDYILEYYSPICPKCGKLMVPNKSKRNKNYGHRFYGCSGWLPGGNGCQHTIDID